MPNPTLEVDVRLSEREWSDLLRTECIAGLTADPKWLSPVWFYDAHGSDLFDRITRLPEYYPTRAERSLLEEHSAEIEALTGADTLVELGSGTSDKTRLLLDAMDGAGRLRRYVPFDVSEPTVRAAAGALHDRYPDLAIHAVIGDFHQHLGAIPVDGRRLVAFLGGTLGNLDPAERRRFLADVRATLGPEDRFLVGVDLVKDPVVLVDAYDDRAGVTAAFNRNALSHLNARFGGDFDPTAFRHVVRWDPRHRWIEMHLSSERDQAVRLEALGLTVEVAAGETIRTEISAKFTSGGIASELAACRLRTERTWRSDPGFLLVLARPG